MWATPFKRFHGGSGDRFWLFLALPCVGCLQRSVLNLLFIQSILAFTEGDGSPFRGASLSPLMCRDSLVGYWNDIANLNSMLIVTNCSLLFPLLEESLTTVTLQLTIHCCFSSLIQLIVPLVMYWSGDALGPWKLLEEGLCNPRRAVTRKLFSWNLNQCQIFG